MHMRIATATNNSYVDLVEATHGQHAVGANSSSSKTRFATFREMKPYKPRPTTFVKRADGTATHSKVEADEAMAEHFSTASEGK